MRSKLLVWALLRSLVAWLTFGPLWSSVDCNSDVIGAYYRWQHLIMGGAVPYKDFHVEYPPGVLPLLSLPGHGARTYALAFFLAALAADLYTTVRLHRSGHSRGAWVWVLTPPVLGPIFWGRFDVFVAAALVLAVLAVLAAEQRHWRGASAWWLLDGCCITTLHAGSKSSHSGRCPA